MSKIKVLIDKYGMTVSLVGLVVGGHLLWSHLQTYEVLVPENERDAELPITRAGKLIYRKIFREPESKPDEKSN